MFDMSGSGKSQGDHITYGLKESEDIGSHLIMQNLSFPIFISRNI